MFARFLPVLALAVSFPGMAAEPGETYDYATDFEYDYVLGLDDAGAPITGGAHYVVRYDNRREAIDAQTALRIGLVSRVFPAEELPERVEEYARKFRHIPANQLALNKLLVNQAFENMGLRTTQLLGTFFDGVTRHTEEAYRWAESFAEKGFREVIRERDRPWGDYGERKRG